MKERTSPRRSRALPPLRSERLLDKVRERVRYLNYSIRTEQAYVHWIRAFVRFHGVRHPAEMAASEVEAFLTWLAAERRVAAATHRQALSAIVFLYEKVLELDLAWLAGIGRPQAPPRLPVVLSHGEVAAVLSRLATPGHRLFGELLYGTGMRLMEGLRLRVKDIEFEHRAIIVREGKGAKDRVVMLPTSIVPALREQLRAARDAWQSDREAGAAGVQMPDALARKYPRAASSWTWFWVFPQAMRAVDPRAGVERRHHAFDQSGAVRSPLDLLRSPGTSAQDGPGARHDDTLDTRPNLSPRVREPDVGYRVFPCCRATPSSTAAATSAS